MVCVCYLLFQATYFTAILGYPIKCFYELYKKKETDPKWIYYFFLLIVVYIGELTFLFPLKYLLNKIDFCMFPTVKAFFALWLYYPEKNGISLIESLVGNHVDKAFLKMNGIIGKYAEMLGIPNRGISFQKFRESDSDKKKSE
jgi:hypothetical protein